jgi:WD40 repeat protein
MSQSPTCPACGSRLPADAPAGVCPRCLLQAGMEDLRSEAPDEATLIADSQVRTDAPWLPPTEHSGRNDMTPAAIGTRVKYFGDYELLDEIARGGMGIVYRARQVRLNRIVALKMILAGRFAGATDIQRFYMEAEAAAKLDHPGIVPIFEVGEHDGHHFFSMRFVEGESLARRIADGPLAARAAAELVRNVAEAIQFAHSQGVIHRDLKPANILLGQDGQTQVTDFGLAKCIQGDSQLTATGQILGTPGYMPPEQAAGRMTEVRATADVYSLGAILYATLTGRAPFQADNPLDTVMQVLEREPVAIRQLNPTVPRDLETICLKCLEKDRRKRYPTAQALADELGRWLRGEPIVARPVGNLVRSGKWIRRHPTVSGLLAAVILTMLAGSAVSTWFGIQSQFAAKSEAEARRDADEKRRLAERLAEDNGRLAEAERTANLTLRVFNARLQLDKALIQLEQGHVIDGLFDLTDALDGPSDDLQEVVRANLALWQSKLHRLQGEQKYDTAVTGIATAHDRKRAALLFARDGSHVGECRLWDIERQQPIGEQLILSSLEPQIKFTAASLLLDQATLLAATSRGVLHRWNLETGQSVGVPVQIPPAKQVRSTAAIDHLAVSPDGSRLLAASRQKRIAWLLDPKTLQPVSEPLTTKGWISCVGFSADSATMLLGLGGGEGYVQRGAVLLWNARTGEPMGDPLPHPGQVLSLDTNHQGTLLAIGGSDRSIVMWDLTTRLPTGVKFAHDAPVTRVRFSPSDPLLVSADADGTIQFCDPHSSHQPGSRLPERVPVTDLAFGSLGKTLLTASADGIIKSWQVGTGWEPDQQWSLPGLVSRVVVDETQRTAQIAWHGSTTEPGALQTWDVAIAKPIGAPRSLGKPNSAVVTSPDLHWAVSWQAQTDAGKPNFVQQVELWDVSAGTSQTISLAPANPLPATGTEVAPAIRMIFFAEFSPGSRYLLIAALPIVGPQGRIWIYDTVAGNLVGEPLPYVHPTNPRALEQGMRLPLFRFDRAGKNVLCADLEGANVWSLETAEKVFSGPKLADFARDLAFSSNGELIAIAAGREVITVSPIDARASEPAPIQRLPHASVVTTVAFSPQGNLLATGSDDRVVRLWNTATGDVDGKHLVHSARITRVIFNPQGTRLAVACDRDIFLWDVSTRERVGPAIQHPAGMGLFEFTPNGSVLLTSGDDNVLRRWNMNTTAGNSAADERTQIESLSGFKREGGTDVRAPINP